MVPERALSPSGTARRTRGRVEARRGSGLDRRPAAGVRGPAAAVARRRLTAAGCAEALPLYMALLKRSAGTGNWEASTEALADKLRVTVRTVERWRSALVSAGLLEVERRGPRPLRYTLPDGTDRPDRRPDTRARKDPTQRPDKDPPPLKYLVNNRAFLGAHSLKNASLEKLSIGEREPDTPSPAPLGAPAGAGESGADVEYRGMRPGEDVVAGTTPDELLASAPGRARRWRQRGDTERRALLEAQAAEILARADAHNGRSRAPDTLPVSSHRGDTSDAIPAILARLTADDSDGDGSDADELCADLFDGDE